MGMALALGDVDRSTVWPLAVERYLALWCERESTRRNYGIWLRRAFGDFGVRSVGDLSLVMLEHHRAGVMAAPLAPATKKLQIACLRSFLRWARAHGLHRLDEDSIGIVLRVPRTHTLTPHRALRLEELRRLLLAARPGRDRTCIALMVGLGLRISECSALDVRDFLAGETPCLLIRQGKGGRDRLVPVSDQLVPLIMAHIGRRSASAPLFETIRPRGRRLGIAGIRERVEAASDQAGLVPRVTPHDLRHTFGTRHYRAGKDIVATSQLLGHRSIETTMIYVNHAELAALRATIPALPV